MGQLICPGARLHKAHRFRFRGSERGRLRVMIPCWWGLPSSFQGGLRPGKAEERKNQLNAGDGGRLCWCGGKGAGTSLPRQTWDIPGSIHPLSQPCHTSSFLTQSPNPSLPFAPLPGRIRNLSPAHPPLQVPPSTPSATFQGAEPSTPLSHVHSHPPRAVH